MRDWNNNLLEGLIKKLDKLSCEKWSRYKCDHYCYMDSYTSGYTTKLHFKSEIYEVNLLEIDAPEEGYPECSPADHHYELRINETRRAITTNIVTFKDPEIKALYNAVCGKIVKEDMKKEDEARKIRVGKHMQNLKDFIET